MRRRTMSQEAPLRMGALSAPMSRAMPGVTTAQLAVTATRPDRMPLSASSTDAPAKRVGFFLALRDEMTMPMTIATSEHEADDSTVLAAMRPRSCPANGLPEYTAPYEPTLKAIQPRDSKKVPSVARCSDDGGRSFCTHSPRMSSKRGGFTSWLFAYLLRKPTMTAPTRPMVPPVRWTTPDPAKSMAPMLASQPSLYQSQRATTG
mmetsp:Transcript_13434/g.42336  ORF Transcript_13434/g.42336 Transcript_13434/m.42336 type:complete len:205 (-) Transcript_13434:529-1143(-)